MAVKPVPDPRPEEPEPMFGPDVELIRALAAVLDEAGSDRDRDRRRRKPHPHRTPGHGGSVRRARGCRRAPGGGRTGARRGSATCAGRRRFLTPRRGDLAPRRRGLRGVRARRTPPFVSVGDEISEGDTLFIVEAMKTMNPVRAPSGGRVARILAENGARVEYGEVLLILE